MPHRSIIFCILCLSCAFILFSAISTAAGQQQGGFLKVIVLVNNTGGGSAQPSDLSVTIENPDGGAAYTKVDPTNYDGSTNGTISSAVQGTYLVDLGNNVIKGEPYSLDFSGDCVGKGLSWGEVRVQPGDKKTCIVTASYVRFD
jgi:hypothetical protein